jgi:arabinogalactan oligomer/maltooligosaccharide transport system permease protein
MSGNTGADPSAAEANSKWRALIATTCGAIVFFALLIFLCVGARNDLAARAEGEAAARAALGLAAVVQAAPQTEPGATFQQLTTDFANRLELPGASARIVDLDQRTLLASTDPQDGLFTGAPRALTQSEKPIYDRGKSLARIPSAAIAGIVRTPQSTIALATAPVRDASGERIRASVEVSLPLAPRQDDRSPWLWLGAIALGALAVAAGLGQRFAPRAGGLSLAALAVILATTLIIAPPALEQLSQLDQAAAEAQSTSVQNAVRTLAEQRNWQLNAQAIADLAPETSAAQARTLQAVQDLRLSTFAAGLLGLAVAAFIGFGWAAKTWRTVIAHRTAYIYLAPALIGMLALSIFPFLYGVSLSVTDTTLLNQDQAFTDRFVGLQHYATILGDFQFTTGTGADLTVDYTNFYWTLGMTIAWTVSNVAIGVTVGLALALLLNTKGLRGAGVYRTLLILPWAIPNYITALTWKGIFHPQFGAANQVVQAFGGEPVAWFDSVWPSFLTGVITNGWLSFPFMMVVCLGALQAIDEDMYEAARIDGANPWQRFRYITLPSLMPALLPAIIVSVVWTFNMFNVIYLVSAGQPGGATEILITRAYKVAFEEYQYGYAAAYSVVIFLILLIYSGLQVRLSRATESVR